MINLSIFSPFQFEQLSTIASDMRGALSMAEQIVDFKEVIEELNNDREAIIFENNHMMIEWDYEMGDEIGRDKNVVTRQQQFDLDENRIAMAELDRDISIAQNQLRSIEERLSDLFMSQMHRTGRIQRLVFSTVNRNLRLSPQKYEESESAVELFEKLTRIEDGNGQLMIIEIKRYIDILRSAVDINWGSEVSTGNSV